MQQTPKLFEIEHLIALYMVNAHVTKVSLSQLCNFNEYLSTKLAQNDLSLPQDKRLNSSFIFSNFHLKQMNKKDSCLFCVSQIGNGKRIISCTNQESPEKALKELEEKVLAVSFSQNAGFMTLAKKYTQQYVQEKQILKSKEKMLTPEQDAQRWWDYFGK